MLNYSDGHSEDGIAPTVVESINMKKDRKLFKDSKLNEWKLREINKLVNQLPIKYQLIIKGVLDKTTQSS